MEYEIRFYYPHKEYVNKINLLNNITDLRCNGRNYEKTSQFNHPDKKYDFYSKEIDGRFRVRITKGKGVSKCMLSWKRRVKITLDSNVNKEEEVELTIKPSEYDSLMFIVKKVLKMKEVESYERYRTTYSNSDVEIALDEYPFGLALEIEAKTTGDKAEKVIDKYVKLLNLDYKDSYRLSWDDKYEELCKSQHKKVLKHVLFNSNVPKIK